MGAPEGTGTQLPSPSETPSDICRPIYKVDTSTAIQTLVTIAEAGRLFGRDNRTIRRWLQKGLLPAVRIGRSAFIPADEVSALISEALEFADIRAASLRKATITNVPSEADTSSTKALK
jgi:excisionase family DNA binding protein